MHTEELDTPALLVDLDIMEGNVRRMAEYAARHSLKLCPHTKTHKIPDLAKQQLALGAHRITVAKLGEAEVMAGSGIGKMLVAYPIYGPDKWKRLALLAQDCDLSISLDSLEVAAGIAHAVQGVHGKVGVLVEVDVGLRRCGVPPPKATELAAGIAETPGLELEGLMFYPGHIKNPERQKSEFKQLQAVVEALCESFEKAGLPHAIVSGGSTPTAFHCHRIPGLTEMRPGTYIFNDANEVGAGVATLEMCAARVLARVVSTAVSGQMIVDAGSKTLSSARSWNPEDRGLGWIWGERDARLRALNEEHGYVDLAGATRRYKVGDLVEILPNHICECMNLQERVYAIRNGKVETMWEVQARGKIR